MKRTLIMGYLCIAALLFISVSCSNEAEELKPITSSIESIQKASYVANDDFSPFHFELYYDESTGKFKDAYRNEFYPDFYYSGTPVRDMTIQQYYLHMNQFTNTLTLWNKDRWNNSGEIVISYLDWEAVFEIQMSAVYGESTLVFITNEEWGHICDFFIDWDDITKEGKIKIYVHVDGDYEIYETIVSGSNVKSPFNRKLTCTLSHKPHIGTVFTISDFGTLSSLPISINPFAFEFPGVHVTRIYGIDIHSKDED